LGVRLRIVQNFYVEPAGADRSGDGYEVLRTWIRMQMWPKFATGDMRPRDFPR